MDLEPSGSGSVDSYLLGQVREAFGRVAYAQKTREKEADLCWRHHRRIQCSLVLLTAISSGTFLVALLGYWFKPAEANLVTSAVAVLVAGLSLAAKTFTFEALANEHRAVASRLWDIRESYVSLISDMLSGNVDSETARDRRDQLQDATHEAYQDAPRTSPRAYQEAKKGLTTGEELTFSAAEIDHLLPEALRSQHPAEQQ